MYIYLGWATSPDPSSAARPRIILQLFQWIKNSYVRISHLLVSAESGKGIPEDPTRMEIQGLAYCEGCDARERSRSAIPEGKSVDVLQHQSKHAIDNSGDSVHLSLQLWLGQRYINLKFIHSTMAGSSEIPRPSSSTKKWRRPLVTEHLIMVVATLAEEWMDWHDTFHL